MTTAPTITQAMTVHWELTRLNNAFAFYLDHGAFDSMIRLFTPDALFDRAGTVHRGHDELRKGMAERPNVTGVIVSKILSNTGRVRTEVSATGVHQGRRITLARAFDLDLTTAFKLAPEPARVSLSPGESAKVRLTVSRVKSFDGPVTLHLPRGRTIHTNTVNVIVAVAFAVMGGFILYLADTGTMTSGPGFQVSIGKWLAGIFAQIGVTACFQRAAECEIAAFGDHLHERLAHAPACSGNNHANCHNDLP